MGRQSSTAARTSPRTLRTPSLMASRASAWVCSLTSKCIRDSRTAPSSGAGWSRNSITLPSLSRLRHVVVDHLDDSVGRLPAVLLDARVIDANLGLARSAALGELPQRQRRPIKVLDRLAQHVLGRNVGIVPADKALDRIGSGAAQALTQKRRHLFDPLGFLLPVLRLHGKPFLTPCRCRRHAGRARGL